MDFSSILGHPREFNYQIWERNAPKFYGHPHLALQYIASFIEIVTDFNSLHEDVMMRIFILSLRGKDGWIWYYDFNPKQIIYFQYRFKAFQYAWVDGYDIKEEIEDACILIHICVKIGEKISNLSSVYDENPSRSLLAKISERYGYFCPWLIILKEI